MKNNILLKLFSTVIITLFLSTIVTNKVYASISLPYSENFNGGSITNWSIYSPSSNSSFSVINGEFVGTAYSTSNFKVLHYATLNDKQWVNYVYYIAIKGLIGLDKPILFRFDQNGSFYSVNLRTSYNDVELNKRLILSSNQSDTRLAYSSANKAILNNQWYVLTVSVRNINSNVYINVYLDNNLVIDNYIDSDNPILAGGIGVSVWPENGGESVSFDNITVLPFDGSSTPAPTIIPTLTPIPTVTPTPTPTTIPTSAPTPTPTSTPTPSYLQVLDIKQGTSPWGSQEYDNAHKWAAANPTISRWGCALTSAVMAMRYHGFINVWPDILNNWLKATPGGYTKDGGVNWIAISRYTKLFPNLSGESLEYKFFNSNLHPLSFLLDNNIVPIINFPHHFLIAKGYTNPSDYLINDPASDLITLSAAITKWGNIKKIAYYQPSKSDLSYLYFVVDPNVNLNLFNSLGNQVNMEYIFSEPLVDDTDPTIYGLGPFGKYFLPQPPIDKYKLEITGNGPYSIDSYFYNIEGNVRIATISGTITTNNNVDKYTLTYNYQNPTIKKDDIITINVLIKDIENVHKQKLIPSYLYYLELRSQAVLAKMLINKKQSKDAKVVLRLMKWSLNAANSRLIKSEAKQILLNDINSLISSLP